MSIRCKFKCTSITERANYPEGKVWDAKLDVVTSGSDENKDFFKYTPNGQMNVACIRQNSFEVGKEYYIDITEAVPPAVEPPAAE